MSYDDSPLLFEPHILRGNKSCDSGAPRALPGRDRGSMEGGHSTHGNGEAHNVAAEPSGASVKRTVLVRRWSCDVPRGWGVSFGAPSNAHAHSNAPRTTAGARHAENGNIYGRIGTIIAMSHDLTIAFAEKHEPQVRVCACAVQSSAVVSAAKCNVA